MFRRKTLPTPPPIDPVDYAEAMQAKKNAEQTYVDSIAKATAATLQGDRMRTIRVVNNIGPAFGAVYERRRHA